MHKNHYLTKKITSGLWVKLPNYLMVKVRGLEAAQMFGKLDETEGSTLCLFWLSATFLYYLENPIFQLVKA